MINANVDGVLTGQSWHGPLLNQPPPTDGGVLCQSLQQRTTRALCVGSTSSAWPLIAGDGVHLGLGRAIQFRFQWMMIRFTQRHLRLKETTSNDKKKGHKCSPN